MADHPTDTSEQEAELLLDVFRSKIFKDSVTQECLCAPFGIWIIRSVCVCVCVCTCVCFLFYPDIWNDSDSCLIQKDLLMMKK